MLISLHYFNLCCDPFELHVPQLPNTEHPLGHHSVPAPLQVVHGLWPQYNLQCNLDTSEIFNYSNIVLTDLQQRTLSLGFKFCITPTSVNLLKVKTEFEKLYCNLSHNSDNHSSSYLSKHFIKHITSLLGKDFDFLSLIYL